jgi:hypothetical protein
MTDETISRERRPLSFPDWDTYRRFQGLLRACFGSEGITDAVVQQIGSPCTGCEMDPLKYLAAGREELAGWTADTPVELMIFSRQSLVQAMEASLSVDRSLTWRGKYVRLLARTDASGRGLTETPLGRKLAALGAQVTSLLPGHPEVRFALCLAAEPFAEGPFEGAIVILSPDIFPAPT